jgi:hypothetical protein
MSTSYFVAADWLIEHGDDPEVRLLTRVWPRRAGASRRSR